MNNVEGIERNVKLSPERRRSDWSNFIERNVLDFFNEYRIERMVVEDGDGNKAKISRSKEHEIKVEVSSMMTF
ncbi:MAG: hypothetical protein CfP315_0450 [Candidatus Improbicoccus pseudotrichonymphae]|uniref:Uncharacterized protein n=1 Tax=Candidatus Improbicoccus pseudotrichonymphae TaxID=3033792 RepID=A0AA48KX10_9FIRM|nr:MAG: hypothetical protein CfP315_0450 [Candidatus Improbicoccus pseudotrichonymphae]